MESEPTAAEHDGIPAVSDGVGVDIAQVRSIARKRLTRHPDQLIALNKNELWVEVIVSFNESAVPLRYGQLSPP